MNGYGLPVCGATHLIRPPNGSEMLSSIVCARNWTPFVEESSTRTEGEQQCYVDIRTTTALGSTPTENKGAPSVDGTPGLTGTVPIVPSTSIPSSSSTPPVD